MELPFSFDEEEPFPCIRVPADDDDADEDRTRIGLPSAVTAKVAASGRRTRPLVICLRTGSGAL